MYYNAYFYPLNILTSRLENMNVFQLNVRGLHCESTRQTHVHRQKRIIQQICGSWFTLLLKICPDSQLLILSSSRIVRTAHQFRVKRDSHCKCGVSPWTTMEDSRYQFIFTLSIEWDVRLLKVKKIDHFPEWLAAKLRLLVFKQCPQ